MIGYYEIRAETNQTIIIYIESILKQTKPGLFF